MLPAINSDSDSAKSKGALPEDKNKLSSHTKLNIKIIIYKLIDEAFILDNIFECIKKMKRLVSNNISANAIIFIALILPIITYLY